MFSVYFLFLPASHHHSFFILTYLAKKKYIFCTFIVIIFCSIYNIIFYWLHKNLPSCQINITAVKKKAMRKVTAVKRIQKKFNYKELHVRRFAS